MTPEQLADWLTERTAEVALKAFQRYPNDRTERLADEMAQLRTLIEMATDHLRRMGGAE